MSAKRKNEDEGVSDNKKRKKTQKYKESYTQLWPCLASKKGVHFVYCSVCVCDFTCIHGGRNDCKRHVESKQLKDYTMFKVKQKPITAFAHQSTVQQEAVTSAEVLMAECICHMSLSLSTAGTMCKLVQKMCPDSKIAKEMRATAILHDLACMTSTYNELAERTRTFPFTISTDGSNDETSKQFPLVIRTLDPTTRMVNSELLSIPISNRRNIFSLVAAEFKSKDIPWSNCIAFGSDNANVMIGHRKGLFAYMKEKQPNLYLSGCPLHLIHIAAKKAAEVLLAVDDLLVDVYYFFKNSDKRKSEFRDIQDLCDLNQKKIIKHVCTRWLSIWRFIERLLTNWDALKVYFKDQKDLQDAKKKQRAEKTQGKAPKHQKDLQDTTVKPSVEKTQGKSSGIKASQEKSSPQGSLLKGLHGDFLCRIQGRKHTHFCAIPN